MGVLLACTFIQQLEIQQLVMELSLAIKLSQLLRDAGDLVSRNVLVRSIFRY
jgi:hypothetical protein